MKARMVFCMALRPGFYAALMCAAALLVAATGSSRARDFEMGGDVDYNIMAPEPGTVPHHAVRSERTRTGRGHTQSRTATEGPVTDTPEQIENYKRTRLALRFPIEYQHCAGRSDEFLYAQLRHVGAAIRVESVSASRCGNAHRLFIS